MTALTARRFLPSTASSAAAREWLIFQLTYRLSRNCFAFVDSRVAGVWLVAAGGVSRPGSPGLSGRAVLVTPWTIAALATVGPGNRDPEVCDARDAFEVGRGDAAR